MCRETGQFELTLRFDGLSGRGEHGAHHEVRIAIRRVVPDDFTQPEQRRLTVVGERERIPEIEHVVRVRRIPIGGAPEVHSRRVRPVGGRAARRSWRMPSALEMPIRPLTIERVQGAERAVEALELDGDSATAKRARRESGFPPARRWRPPAPCRAHPARCTCPRRDQDAGIARRIRERRLEKRC